MEVASADGRAAHEAVGISKKRISVPGTSLLPNPTEIQDSLETAMVVWISVGL